MRSRDRHKKQTMPQKPDSCFENSSAPSWKKSNQRIDPIVPHHFVLNNFVVTAGVSRQRCPLLKVRKKYQEIWVQRVYLGPHMKKETHTSYQERNHSPGRLKISSAASINSAKPMPRCADAGRRPTAARSDLSPLMKSTWMRPTKHRKMNCSPISMSRSKNRHSASANP